MRVLFKLERETTIEEVKLDTPPRVDEYVTFQTSRAFRDYKVVSVRYIYHNLGSDLWTNLMIIVQLRSLTKEEEDHVALSRPR